MDTLRLCFLEGSRMDKAGREVTGQFGSVKCVSVCECECVQMSVYVSVSIYVSECV